MSYSTNQNPDDGAYIPPRTLVGNTWDHQLEAGKQYVVFVDTTDNSVTWHDNTTNNITTATEWTAFPAPTSRFVPLAYIDTNTNSSAPTPSIIIRQIQRTDIVTPAYTPLSYCDIDTGCTTTVSVYTDRT